MAEYKNIQRHMQRLAVTLHPSTERHVSLAGGMMACLEEFEESVLALTLSQQDKSKSQGKSGLSESEEDGVDLHADDRMPASHLGPKVHGLWRPLLLIFILHDSAAQTGE